MASLVLGFKIENILFAVEAISFLHLMTDTYVNLDEKKLNLFPSFHKRIFKVSGRKEMSSLM